MSGCETNALSGLEMLFIFAIGLIGCIGVMAADWGGGG